MSPSKSKSSSSKKSAAKSTAKKSASKRTPPSEAQRRAEPHAPAVQSPTFDPAPRRAEVATNAAQIKKERTRDDYHPGFEAGKTVHVYKAIDVELEANRHQKPFSEPLSKPKVKKDGSVNLKVDEPGIYTVAGEEEDGSWRFVKVVVK